MNYPGILINICNNRLVKVILVEMIWVNYDIVETRILNAISTHVCLWHQCGLPKLIKPRINRYSKHRYVSRFQILSLWRLAAAADIIYSCSDYFRQFLGSEKKNRNQWSICFLVRSSDIVFYRSAINHGWFSITLFLRKAVAFERTMNAIHSY